MAFKTLLKSLSLGFHTGRAPKGRQGRGTSDVVVESENPPSAHRSANAASATSSEPNTPSHIGMQVSDPSAAQRCPEDVLRIIYYGASRSDCARGTRICRAWHEACVAELYRTFSSTKTDFRSSSEFVHHLSNSRDLCAHVKHMVVTVELQKPRVQMLSISTLFTPDLTKSSSPSYLRLNGDWHVGQVPEIIAKSAMIRQVSYLDLWDNGLFHNNYHSTPNLKAALQIILPAASSIVSFSAGLDTCTMAPKPISKHRYPSLPLIPLRRLSLSIMVFGYEVLPLFTAVSNTLEQLHLHIMFERTYGLERNACVQAISNMHNLVELMIHAHQFTSPILDEIVPHLSNLRYLFCGEDTFTTALIDGLPPSLEGLHLVGRPPDPSSSWISPYETMRQLLTSPSLKTNMPHLRYLYWWNNTPCTTRADRPAAAVKVEGMARAADVTFQLDNYDEGSDKWLWTLLEPSFSLESTMPPKRASQAE